MWECACCGDKLPRMMMFIDAPDATAVCVHCGVNCTPEVCKKPDLSGNAICPIDPEPDPS